MYVLLKRSRFAWPFFSKLSKTRRYSLHEAEKTIRETNRACLDSHKKLVVVISIHDQASDELLFRDALELGTDAPYLGNLLALVQHTFKEVLDNVSSEDARRFIATLQTALVAETAPGPVPESDREPGASSEEKPESAHKQSPQSEAGSSEGAPGQRETAHASPEAEPDATVEEDSKAEPEPVEEPPRREPGHPEPKVERKRRTRRGLAQGGIIRKHKRLLIGLAAALLALLCVFGSYRFFFSSKAAPQPSYQSLVRGEKYIQAAQVYPEKRSNIEAVVVTDGTTAQLAKFQAKYPSANGKFDLAYAQQKYLVVITASQEAAMTRVRKSKLAVAYIKTKQYEQAEILNQDLNDQDLQSLIAIGYIQTGKFDQAKQINAELKNKTIDQAIQTGETYQKAVEHYQSIANDKTKSAAERAQAKASAASFQHQLETLGE
ncbi:hypothetical protein [Lacticaseibacillus daqingensis]|uniref:hypothetical protein n=1 Tax=Lacticaseibacillus daqingensis TaxID=2486014 RepID=UPI000F788698|nr:hypothetical protein [Lacticaseibacillus daqingensis]